MGGIPRFSSSATSTPPLTTPGQSLRPEPPEPVELASVEHEEHVANVMRMHELVRLGVVIWPSFALVDWLACHTFAPGALPTLLSIRLVFMLMALWALTLFGRKRMFSADELRALDVYFFLAFSVAISAMAVHVGGWRSPYFAGVLVAMGCRGTAVAEPWRRALLPNIMHGGAYFVVLGVATLGSAELRQQWHEPDTASYVCIAALALVMLAARNVWASDALWRTRRFVLETGWLAQYELKHKLGAGGMGTVWAAHHTGLRRDVALKIVREDLTHNDTAHRRFEREVRAVSQLRHPHTVRILDYGVDDHGRAFFAMELLEGETLQKRVERTGPLAPAQVIHLSLHLAQALAEAHRLGIVHRDIKPDNVFLTHNGVEADFAKVLDFGLARLLDVEGTQLTREGTWLGTPAYISPEGADGQRVDARSDLYALGCVMYFALTGRPPFERANKYALLLAHATQPVPPLDRHAPEPIPERLEGIVLRCLQKHPSDRYRDAEELVVALECCAILCPYTPPRAAKTQVARGKKA